MIFAYYIFKKKIPLEQALKSHKQLCQKHHMSYGEVLPQRFNKPFAFFPLHWVVLKNQGKVWKESHSKPQCWWGCQQFLQILGDYECSASEGYSLGKMWHQFQVQL